MLKFLTDAKKFLTALSGAVAVAITAGLLDGDVQRWVVGCIAVATAFVVYLVPNGGGSGANVDDLDLTADDYVADDHKPEHAEPAAG